MEAEPPFSVPDTVLVRELQGETVLLDLASETYFGLDEVGTRMWRALSEGGAIRAACDLLLEEYDVDRTVLEADLRALAARLVDAGLLRAAA
jgi:hypothetical protein